MSHEEDVTLFFDCYLVCDTGRKFPSIRGVLLLKSKVIRDLLTTCSQDPRGLPSTIEVPLVGESEEDVELLWQLWHGKLQLFDEVLNVRQPALQKQTLDRIMSIARLADKYQSTELLSQMESLLLFNELFNAIVYTTGFPYQSPLDYGRVFQLWTLACEYEMRKLLSKIESTLSQEIAVTQQLSSFGEASSEEALKALSGRGFQNAAVSLLKILRERDEQFAKERASYNSRYR